MGNGRAQSAIDWAGSFHNYAVAWGLPHIVLGLALLLDAPARAIVWSIALGWMGSACILNARRCRRTHCRYTGPFYLAMTIPVVVLGSGIVSVGIYGWLLLGGMIVGSSQLIWWITECEWGKFS
jgi:hypothetical protein